MPMETVTIIDPEDRSLSVQQDFFDNPQILYHGSWSTYAKAIEAKGFVHGALPFDWKDVATVFEAHRAIGRGSYLPVFLGENYPREEPPRDLSITGNFWFARAYATDGGGEVVRKTIEEAGIVRGNMHDPGETGRTQSALAKRSARATPVISHGCGTEGA